MPNITLMSLLFALSALVLTPAPGHAIDRGPLSVEVNMARAEFRLGDPVTGKIIVRNRSGANLKAAFYIQLYQDGELRYDAVTAVDFVMPGRNEYSLDDLNIPPLEHDPDAQGQWRLVVRKKSGDGWTGGEASFWIRPGP